MISIMGFGLLRMFLTGVFINIFVSILWSKTNMVGFTLKDIANKAKKNRQKGYKRLLTFLRWITICMIPYVGNLWLSYFVFKMVKILRGVKNSDEAYDTLLKLAEK